MWGRLAAAGGALAWVFWTRSGHAVPVVGQRAEHPQQSAHQAFPHGPAPQRLWPEPLPHRGPGKCTGLGQEGTPLGNVCEDQ